MEAASAGEKSTGFTARRLDSAPRSAIESASAWLRVVLTLVGLSVLIVRGGRDHYLMELSERICRIGGDGAFIFL